MPRFHLLALALGVSCTHPFAAQPKPFVATLATAALPTPAPPPFVRSPAGFTKLLADYDALVATRADEAALERARVAIDRMAGQRDAYASRLYWYTDLDDAKAEAVRTGRPILSLRMLGRLDEELSCANSRLFRLVLYANAQVAQMLRDDYVLHWSSERPVPRITLDYGDGRVVTRTITGNSVHYVLDARGRVVDALPGLYGPAAFMDHLRESLDLARRSGGMDDDEAGKAISKHHAHAERTMTTAWRRILMRAYGESYGEYVKDASLPALPSVSWSSPLYSSLAARVVNELTYSKADTEAPSAALMQPDIQVSGQWGDWSKIARYVPADHIDDSSRALIRAKHPRDWSASDAHELADDVLTKHLSVFDATLREEDARNEYVFHHAVHGHLTSKHPQLDFVSVNEFMYTHVFLTPKSDAWLGLSPTTPVTGLANDGLVKVQ
jgi:hypothetical protein